MHFIDHSRVPTNDAGFQYVDEALRVLRGLGSIVVSGLSPIGRGAVIRLLACHQIVESQSDDQLGRGAIGT